jgi:hypothetical protein
MQVNSINGDVHFNMHVILLWTTHDLLAYGIIVGCRNPSFGFATKAKGLQRCGPGKRPGITSYTPGSVRKCEGENPHTPKATPTLGDGIPMESQNFRERF